MQTHVNFCEKHVKNTIIYAIFMLTYVVLSEIRTVDQELGFAMCRRLAKEEGIFCGGSTGLNVAGAIEIAKEMESGQRVVTLACDSGLKYLGGNIYT